MNDLISRQAAIDLWEKYHPTIAVDAMQYDAELRQLPSAQPELIRCKDCRWWDKYGDYDNGYCMAAKHGYWSEHWEISIRRKYKGDFFCADAEMRGDAANEQDD